MQGFDKYFWGQQNMASKSQELTSKKRSRLIQIIPKRGVELLKENICVLRVIINLGHIKALSKHKWPSEMWSKICILSNLSLLTQRDSVIHWTLQAQQ